jgi:hypothetical protein
MVTAVQIISRTRWGARYAAGAGPAPLPAREVWLHHSVTIAPDLVPPFDDEDQAMRQLEQIGQNRFHRGVSYTFAAMPTGRIYEGHGIDRLGAHTKNRNGFARAIVLVGNYDVDDVTEDQVDSIAQLLVDGQRAGWWLHARLNGGHQQAPGAATECPGKHGMAAIADINTRAAQLLAGLAARTLAELSGRTSMHLVRDPHTGAIYLITEQGVRYLRSQEEWNCFQWLLDDDRDVDVDARRLGIGDTPDFNARFVDVIITVLARPVLTARPV